MTGKVNGEIKREIPDSFYREAYGSFHASINIFDPKGEYTNEFFGTKDGRFENTIKSGPKLTCEEFLKKIKNN